LEPAHASTRPSSVNCGCQSRRYQVISVAVPHTAINHGAVNTTYRIPKVNNAKVHLKAKLTSATTCKGEMRSNNYYDCSIEFVAQPHR
jgi:hypothetical protein